MAQRMNSRGGSSRSSGSRSAPSTNMAAYAFAVVLVVAVVLVLVVLNSGKDKAPDADPLPVSTAPLPTKPVEPAKPAEKPYPPVAPALITKAKALVKTFEAPGAEGDRLYDEGMRARKAGDETTWQSKMEEAVRKYDEIKDAWNELIGELPESKDYDQEQVANHYLGREGSEVTRRLTRLAAIRKTLRLH